MKIEKGMVYISAIIILMAMGVYIAYRAIFSNVIQEALVGLFLMVIIAILIKYIGNCVEKELEKKDI